MFKKKTWTSLGPQGFCVIFGLMDFFNGGIFWP